MSNVLYFGTYDREYSRNRILLRGLRENGIRVIECSDRSRSLFKYAKLIFRYLMIREDFDAMVVGFPGQEVMFLARLLTRKPIIFDAFTSHYGGHVLDRRTSSPKSLKAVYYRFMDTYSCRLADVVLLDTQAHIDFFVREFKLPRAKFKRIFVGSDSDIFYPRLVQASPVFLVHFHGNYIPLQGVRYIIEAAKILEDENVHFNLIGRGQTYLSDSGLSNRLNLKNVTFYEKVPYASLPELMARADVCLGIFGNTPKTDLVIPNKVFEALAMGKPVITADTPGIRELLKDGENAILCQKADSQDLADKIRILVRSAPLREHIGKAGETLFRERLTEQMLGKELLDHLYGRNVLKR